MILSSKQLKIVDRLMDVAETSTMRSRHGAAIVRNGKIQNSGVNYNTRSMVSGNIVPSIHAEINVMHRALAMSKGSCKLSCHA